MCSGSCNKSCKSSCCDTSNLEIDKKVLDMDNKILLMGNPNVGKSVFFTALTGVYTMSSNYAGTTVSYTKGKMILNEKEYSLIDVPGTYSLTASNQAESVAISFMNSGAKAIVCVLDATNLSRNLNLALEIKRYGVPVVYALNLCDIAERKGIVIDVDALEKELGAPVIKTVAVKREGIDLLKEKIEEVSLKEKTETSNEILDIKELWGMSNSIVSKCVSRSDQNLKFIDRLGENLMKPWPGIPLALIVMIITLGVVVFGGKGVRSAIFIPLVDNGIVPLFVKLFSSMNLPSMLENILIGEYGIFVIGFQWTLGLLVPYVTIFYLAFTFLEDCGFLPRMAVLFDNVMRKMGLQGGSLINLIMGYGCAVPAILGTRNAATRKERIIITAMVCFAVPCISQTTVLVALLSEQAGFLAVLAIFALSFLIVFLVAVIGGKLLKGKVEPIVLEVPNLLLPDGKSYFKKFLIRMKGFLLEAEGPMLIAIVIAAVMWETGLLAEIAQITAPLMTGVLGLPEEAVGALILGVIRREMSFASLQHLNLNVLQWFVAAVISLLYLPCISVFGVIAKELKARVAVCIGIGTFVLAIGLGAIVNLIGGLFF